MIKLLFGSEVVLAPLPKWSGDLQLVNLAEVQAAISRQSPGCQFGPASDSGFDSVPIAMLQAAAIWTIGSLKALGVNYRTNAFDCENYQRELCQTLAKMAAKSGLDLSPCAGGLTVRQQEAWGGVPTGGLHQVAVAHTPEHGLVVIEPQAAFFTWVPIEAYPNRASILRGDDF